MLGREVDYREELVLVVDDNTVLRETLEKLLQNLGFETDSTSSGVIALEELQDQEYSFLLTDMKMPEMDGIELIEKANNEFPELSIIAMTGYPEGYKYVDVINAGANDFIKKPFDIEELEAKIRRVINERDLRRELNRLVITDSLTGLFNQRHFYSRLSEELTRSRRQGHQLALILMDLDNFKAYNDNHGHLAGDDILRKVGNLINSSIREGVDSGYRYGGDEFAIILIDADLSIAREIGTRVGNALKENGTISASLGYSRFTEGMSVKDFIEEADRELYQSKTRLKKRNKGDVR